MKKVFVKSKIIIAFEKLIKEDITQKDIDEYNERVVEGLKGEGAQNVHIETTYEVKNYEEQNN